jgi:hypothetical protein
MFSLPIRQALKMTDRERRCPHSCRALEPRRTGTLTVGAPREAYATRVELTSPRPALAPRRRSTPRKALATPARTPPQENCEPWPSLPFEHNGNIVPQLFRHVNSWTARLTGLAASIFCWRGRLRTVFVARAPRANSPNQPHGTGILFANVCVAGGLPCVLRSWSSEFSLARPPPDRPPGRRTIPGAPAMAAAEARTKIAGMSALTNAWRHSAASAAIALAIRSILDRGCTAEAADPRTLPSLFSDLFAAAWWVRTFRQSRERGSPAAAAE